MHTVKWYIVKAVVLKSVAGLEFRKMKAFTSSLTPRKKPSEASGSQTKPAKAKLGEDALKKGKMLFGSKYTTRGGK